MNDLSTTLEQILHFSDGEFSIFILLKGGKDFSSLDTSISWSSSSFSDLPKLAEQRLMRLAESKK